MYVRVSLRLPPALSFQRALRDFILTFGAGTERIVAVVKRSQFYIMCRMYMTQLSRR